MLIANAFWEKFKVKCHERDFVNSVLFSHYQAILGPLVKDYTGNYFLTKGKDGYFYDETYYPQLAEEDREYSFVPKIPMSFEISEEWKDVAFNGFHIIRNVGVPEELKSEALNETFAPYGLNPRLNMNKSALHPFYMTDMDYDEPEKHKEPKYLTEICKKCLSKIPDGKYKNSYEFHTSDMVKYIYSEDPSNDGPYSYHYDFFPRLPYMFFYYASKHKDIVGREIQICRRRSFMDEKLYSKVTIDEIQDINEVPIEDDMVIVMNTLNPLFLHKVNKLRAENEVILTTNYLWGKQC